MYACCSAISGITNEQVEISHVPSAKRVLENISPHLKWEVMCNAIIVNTHMHLCSK